MKCHKHIVYLFFILLVCAGVPMGMANAQHSSLQRAFVEFSPKYPSSGEKVKAVFHTTSIDTDTALITWSVNGKMVQRSYAGTVYEFEAGAAGTRMNFQVNAVSSSNQTLSTSKTLTVNDVFLVWEGKTYTPPFYLGRALPSPGSYVSIVATPLVAKPNGTFYDKDELFYVWEIQNSSGQKISGKGKHSVTVQSDNPYKRVSIYLEVKDASGEVLVAKKMSIPFTEPALQLYEDSPYVGVYYASTIGNTYGIYKGEATVVAEPYFMSASSRIDPVLTYEWNVGDATYSSPGALMLGAEGGGSGKTTLRLSVKNQDYLLQSARIDKNIEFGERYLWLNQDTTSL